MGESGQAGPFPDPDPAVLQGRGRTAAALVLRALGAAVFLLVLGFFFLTRTDLGAGIVAERVLARLPIQGVVTARDARSERLLEGVRLYDVEIRGNDGILFLVADSVRLRYRLRPFVSGELVLDTLELWRPQVMLTRYFGESEFNVQRLFGSGDTEQGSARSGRSEVVFGGVALHDGEMRILYPARPNVDDRWATVPSPGADGRLVRHRFVGVGARFPSVVLRSSDSPGQRLEIDSLAFSGEVLADPLRVRDLRGSLRYVAGRVDLEMDRAALDDSELRGTAFVEIPPDEGPTRYGFDLEAETLDLADFQWADRRVPDGRVEGGIALDAEGDRRYVTFRALALALRLPESRIELDGKATIVEGHPAFDSLTVRVAPLALAQVAPWLERPLPVEGSVEGTAELDGTTEALAVRGRLTLRSPEPDRGPTTADFSGLLHLDDGLEVTDLRATLDPFDFAILGDLAQKIAVTGPGSLTVEASGRSSGSIRFTADVHHSPADLPSSNALVQGSVSRRAGEWMLDVQADVAPLSLTAFSSYHPEFPLAGGITGALRARGPLRDLTLTTDLATEAGRLAVTARFDATRPSEGYAVEGGVARFALSRLVTTLPAPTVITGFVDIEGRGVDAASLSLDARTRLRESRVGGLHFDTATLVLRVRDGLMYVDTLDGVAGGIAVQGRGTLAMEVGRPAGSVVVAFQSDSLGRLRPLVLGDEVIVRDTLTGLDRELLLAEGVDPDTLPTEADVTMSGSVRGQITLSGSVGDLSARGEADFRRLRFGGHVARGARITFEGSGPPSLSGRFTGRLNADSLTLYGRDFEGAELDVEYTRPRVRADLTLRRSAQENYSARASFEGSREGGTVELEDLALRFDDLGWALRGPAVVAWNEQGLRVENLALASDGSPMRMEADGLIPREGPADLRLHVAELPLGRLARLFQREDLRIGGRVGLTTRIRGTRSSPLITGTVDAHEFTYSTFSLTRVTGELGYVDRTLTLDVGAWQDSLRVLTATGQVPVDLALHDVPRRVPTDREMDLRVVADSLPAALVLARVPALDDVVGTLSGNFQISGTVDDPSPTGTLSLNAAGWTFPALGVRHQDIGGVLTLRPDGTVEVDARGRAGGTIGTTGLVRLQPLSDPTFELVVTAAGFRAVERPDVVGSVSGVVTLTGSYSRPVVRSRDGIPVRVDEGVFYVEEFQRSAGVVDLADPAFFAVVDTSVVNPRPLLGATANPFLRNLRVAVDLVAQRNTWLRSEEMNVEMGGELQVVYDRQSRDLVMLGALQAIRGTYSVLGRSFQVESGSVEFVGTPGINPILSIDAVTRVRPVGAGGGGDPIGIQATVRGTLQDPRVNLTSTEGAIAESDLVSYLVFGVPSYQLASGQAQLLRGAAGSILGTTFGAGLSILQGTLASRLSSLVARAWGLDYFAISQPEQLGLSQTDLSATISSTTFEVGWYLEEDVFLTLLVRPLGQVTGTADPFGGARFDWVLTDTWTLQAFFEDRWLRQPTLGFDQQILNQRKVAGVLLFRDWGYGRNGGRASETLPSGGEALRDAAPPVARLRRRRSG